MMKSSSLGPGRFTALTALCAALLLCGTASATVTLSTVTRAGTSSAATGTAIDNCRGPCPVVVDAGSTTTTTHSTGSAEQIGIRWDEKKYTNLGYDHDTGGGAGVDPQVICRLFYSDLETDGDEAEWTASGADTSAHRYVGAGLLGRPTTVRASGSALTLGTCGSLANGQWAYCSVLTVEGSGSGNAVYVQVAAGDPDGQAAGYIDSYRGCFSTLSWELANVENDDNDTTEWVASTADANEFYHDGGTEIHGKPIGLRINGSDAVEGTCCALGAGEWGWCNPSTCDAADPNANRVMVRLSDNSDPDAQAAGYVQAIYGDGEYIELQHATWNSGNAFFAYVKDKVSDDAITLAAAPSGADSDETNVTGYQAVNPWTDLRYNYSVSCTGSVCIEDITNGDQRPGLTTTEIDETVGFGPEWAFVFAEGFDSDVAGAGGATITVTVNDDANGDTQDSQTIAVDEAAWAGTDYYISAAGNDTTGDGSIGNPWRTWEKLANSLRTVAGGTAKRGFLNRGDTFTVATSPTQWSNETDDVLFTAYGSGALPIVTAGASLDIWDTANTCANIRMKDINFVRTAGTRQFAANGNTSVYMNLLFDYASVSNTGDSIIRGTNSGRYNDNVIWNCIINNTGADVDYALYDSNPSTAGRRAAVVGTKIVSAGDIAAYRTYRNYDNFIAYTEIERTDTIQAVNHNLRVYGGPGNTSYVYLYGLYLHGVGGNEAYIAIQEDGTGEIENVLIDSCYIDNSSGAAAGNAIRFDSAEASDALIRNSIARDVLHFTDAFTSTTVDEIRVYGNSMFSDNTGAKEFIGNSSTNSYRNIKTINNAVYATNNNTSTLFVDGSGTFNTLESTQITNNVWSMGTTNEMALTESVTYDAPANWTAASMKGAQVDLETSPIFALPTSNDFRLCTASGIPDASCSGASPCIDAGWDLPTVYYDYAGAVRNSDDIGAWDDDSVGMDMGAGPPVGSFMLMGVGR